MDDKSRTRKEFELEQSESTSAVEVTAPAETSRALATRGAAASLGPQLMRKKLQRRAARNENGIAHDAENAVGAAAASSGAPLPAGLQQKFESSLGADLSAVRVHTGSDSAAAAEAVSARAYTVGSDIHFAAGQYRPNDADGAHLLAHEVAHTVQQSDGASRKPMFKLDVSTPGDSHEIEADRAADAMVAGAPATLGNASGVSRKIMRDADGFFTDSDGKKRRTVKSAPQAPPPDYAHPAPINWDAQATPTGGTDVPEPALNLPTPNFEAGNPDEVDYRMQIRSDFAAVNASWQEMAPHVTSYNDASKEASIGPDGENWKLPDPKGPATDLGTLAGQQAPNQSNTTVGDLFNNDRKVAGLDDSAVDATRNADKKDPNNKSAPLSTAIGQARDSESDVKDKADQYERAVKNDLTNAGNAVSAAYKKMDLRNASRKNEENAEKLGYAKEAKAQAAEMVDGLVAHFDLADFHKTMRSDVALFAKFIVGGGFDLAIQRLTNDIKQTKLKIQGFEDWFDTNDLNTALNNLDNVQRSLQGEKLTAVRDALARRQKNYNAAGDLAETTAKRALGSDPQAAAKAEKLRTVLYAIPKVETVVAKLSAILNAIRIPQYTEASGKGLGNVSYLSGPFIKAVGRLKGYRGRFEGLQGLWKDRLTDLNRIRDQLNVAGTR
jgi:hypothetical protein